MASPVSQPRPAAIAALETDQQWLADRGIRPLARVGSCITPRLNGTVAVVRSLDAVRVAWDDGVSEWVSWTAISPFGYMAEAVREDGPEEEDDEDELVIIGAVVSWHRRAA